MDRLTYTAGLEQESLAKDYISAKEDYISAKGEYITAAKLTLNPAVVECITTALFAEMMTARTAYDMTDSYRTTVWKFLKCQPNDLTKIISSSPIEIASHLKELE